jgi:PAS domain S-box-containing protein
VFALHRKALAALSRSAAVGSGDLSASLHDLTELAAQILDVARASVWRLHGERGEIECLDLYERSSGTHAGGMILTRTLAPTYFAALEGEEPIAAHDAVSDPRTREFADSYLRPLGITSMLDVPVFRGEQMVGLICHEHVGPARTWTEWDELIASSVADMLALVLTMSEQIAAERALAAHQERLEALVEQRTTELRRTEAGLRNLFEGAPVAVLVIGRSNGKVLLANQRASELLDVPQDGVGAVDPAHLFCDPSDLARVLAAVRAQPFVDELRAPMRGRSGHELWAELSASSVVFEGADAVLLGIHDISKQRATEVNLRESNDTLQQIFSAAPIPLVLTGLRDAVVRYCNRRAAEMFGIPLQEIVGRRAPDFYVEPASREAFVERLRDDGRVDSHAALLKTSGNEPFWALLSAHTLTLAGEAMFMVGFVNISEQKAAEAELQRLNESLSRTLQVLEERDLHIREDLDEARAFQRLTLPPVPADDRFRFAALYRPTSEVGGDIYDVFELEPGRFRVFIADARGHGVQAALRTMVLKSEYDRVRRDATGPGRVLEQLNKRIFERYPGMQLQCAAACFDVEREMDGARVRYAAAAHPPFLHLTPQGTHELILSGPYLGVLPAVDIATAEVHVKRGERFLAYTDGLYEQPGADGAMYGVEQMLADMSLEVPLDEVPTRVSSLLEAFAGSRELIDDVTLIVVEVH